MNTSSREDSLQIQLYIENSRAIFDSLIKYEFAKKRVLTLNKDLYAITEENVQLRISNQLAERQLKQMSVKYKKANRERWIFRFALGKVLLMAFLIR